MDTTNATSEFAAAEQLLADAGFTFTVVDACPHPECEICAATTMPAAA